MLNAFLAPIPSDSHPAKPPRKVTLDLGPAEQCYQNLALSFRGAERQAPSVVSLALRFSAVMAYKQEKGEHPANWNSEKRLQAIVSDFHAAPGMASKWHLEEVKIKAILHMITGTCPAACFFNFVWVRKNAPHCKQIPNNNHIKPKPKPLESIEDTSGPSCSSVAKLTRISKSDIRRARTDTQTSLTHC